MKVNHAPRRICTAIFMSAAALASGCGPGEELAPVCSYLPPPAIVRVDEGPLTPEAALRKCEAEHRVAQTYLARGYRLVATTQNYSGQILDWIAGDSVPGSDKPPPAPIDLSNLNLPPGVHLGKTELELYSELQGPTDAIAIPRMMFSTYVHGETDAGSLEEFLEQSEPQSGLPGGAKRLYTGYTLPMFSMGSVSNVNAFSGPAIEEKTFSLMEMAVGCMWQGDVNTLQLVGMAASRDDRNFNYEPDEAQQLKLQVEYLTQGLEKTGPDPDTGVPRGGWSSSCFGGGNPGFVVKSPTTVAYPGANMQASTMGGAQWEHHFEIQLFNGDWWLALNGEWFGYYPAWRFPLTQNSIRASSFGIAKFTTTRLTTRRTRTRGAGSFRTPDSARQRISGESTTSTSGANETP